MLIIDDKFHMCKPVVGTQTNNGTTFQPHVLVTTSEPVK